MPAVQEYLESLDTMTAPMIKSPGMVSLYGFVRKYGKLGAVTQQSFPKKGKMRECFKNAFNLARDSRGQLDYCEGFALKIIPVHHAWCVDAMGNVVDPTWRGGGTEYIGVRFKFRHVAELVLSREAYGSVIDDWENGWPLLTGKVDPTSVIISG